MATRRLITTGELARELGLSVRTIQRYRQLGLIKPDIVTRGKHARWDLERVRADLRKLAEQDEY